MSAETHGVGGYSGPGVTTAIELAAEAPVTLFRTDDPGEVIARATETANALATVIRSQKLAVMISGREHVKVEGWTMLGSLLGVFPVCVWTREITLEAQTHLGWEARVEARTRAGEVVGAAEAQCLRSEDQWGWEPVGRNGQKLKPRDDFALRSMAQTRATSKALRLPLGFVMTLAGFEATPAEEMPTDSGAGGNSAGRADASSESRAQPDATSAPERATPAQVKKAHTVLGIAAKVAGLIPADYAQLLVSRYGTSHFSELSKSQVSEVIGELERMERDAAIPF